MRPHVPLARNPLTKVGSKAADHVPSDGLRPVLALRHRN